MLDSVSSASSDKEDAPEGKSTCPLIINKAYDSRDKKEVWHSNPVTQATGRTPSCNIVRQPCGPSRFAERSRDSIESCFTIYMRKNLLKVIRKWTNAEGKVVYENDWKEIDQLEIKKFIGLIILIGLYKSKHEYVAQLWNQEGGSPHFNQIMSRTRF